MIQDCCCNKTTSRSEEEKKKMLNRLKRIEGQVRGLQAMIENDSYCNDVLVQSAAVKAAIDRAKASAGEYGMFLDSSVIAGPDKKMWERIL